MRAKTAGSRILLYMLFLMIIQLLSQAAIVWGEEEKGVHATKCDPCISDKNCMSKIKNVFTDVKYRRFDEASKKLKNRPETMANAGIWNLTELYMQCLDGKVDVSISGYMSAKYGTWQASYFKCDEAEDLYLAMAHNALLQCYAERLHELLTKQQLDAVQTAIVPSTLTRPAQLAPSAQKPRLPGWARLGIGLGAGLILSGAVIGGVLGWSESRWASASQAR